MKKEDRRELTALKLLGLLIAKYPKIKTLLKVNDKVLSDIKTKKDILRKKYDKPTLD